MPTIPAVMVPLHLTHKGSLWQPGRATITPQNTSQGTATYRSPLKANKDPTNTCSNTHELPPTLTLE
eukprot:308159-Pelagomonas_calceolata.AAC.1